MEDDFHIEFLADAENKPVVKSSIEDNAQIVNSIMLWRIYDLMWLMLFNQNPELAAQAAEAHAAGEFIGDQPSIAGEPE